MITSHGEILSLAPVMPFFIDQAQVQCMYVEICVYVFMYFMYKHVAGELEAVEMPVLT